MGATDLSVLPQRQVVFPETVFRSGVATDVPLRVQGIVSQSGNLMEWQRNDGAILARIEASGAIGIHHGGQSLDTTSTATQLLFGYAGGTNYRHGIRTRHHSGQQLDNAIDLFVWKFGTDAAGAEPTARVATFDAAGSTLYSSTTVSGNLYATNDVRTVQLYAQPNPSGTAQYYGGMLNILTVAADRKGAVIRGQASQTGNLLELQMPDGAVRTRVAGDSGAVGINVHPTGVAWLAATGINASDVISVFRGLPSHTGNLTQWQDSAGNVMSSVGGDGNMYLAGDRATTYGPNSTWGAYFRVGGNNSLPAVGRAAIAASNGNLHIDAATGTVPTPSSPAGVYLNWYATSTAGTYFGNGGSGQVGRMDGTGAMSAVSFTSTSRLDTKMNMERVLQTGPDDEKLMGLSAVRYNSVFDNKDRPLHSFVAEEVAEIMPEIVSVDENDEIVGINLTSLVTILTTQVQNLTARVRELEAR